ncbi:hypothetical protein PAHAL_1G187400 [Panicum hallii]|uniref:Uncharacterized protein n=1 Tax=Panicum hallii TaxID=206008 RepID=A0A2T8KVV6_9POAL|nr:hypothetical protein PAHAL_1G187400 [Panicum hallii]
MLSDRYRTQKMERKKPDFFPSPLVGCCRNLCNFQCNRLRLDSNHEYNVWIGCVFTQISTACIYVNFYLMSPIGLYVPPLASFPVCN